MPRRLLVASLTALLVAAPPKAASSIEVIPATWGSPRANGAAVGAKQAPLPPPGIPGQPGSVPAPPPCTTPGCVGRNVNELAACLAVGCPDPSTGGSPALAAQQAESELHLPAPQVHLSPQPPVHQKVNLPMWVWVDRAQWQSLSATAAAGSVSATATAEPLQLIIDPGTGDPPVVCGGPGVAYDYSQRDEVQHSDCTYTFTQSSANQPNLEYIVRVALAYHVTWAAQGAPGGGDLGVIRGPPTSIPVKVQEIQIVNG